MSVQLIKNYNLYNVIIKPIITDKSHKISEKFGNTYVFSVLASANKTLIKKAIESIFSVKIKSVNTTIRDTLSRSYKGKRSSSKMKIAYITLSSGSISYDI